MGCTFLGFIFALSLWYGIWEDRTQGEIDLASISRLGLLGLMRMKTVTTQIHLIGALTCDEVTPYYSKEGAVASASILRYRIQQYVGIH